MKQSNANTSRFVFSFMSYGVNSIPHYFGVREDGSIYDSSDWDTFYRTTEMYCIRNTLQFCHPKKDKDREVYANDRYTKLFSFVFTDEYNKFLEDMNSVRPPMSMIYKSVEFMESTDLVSDYQEHEPESKYWSNMATCAERHSL